MHLVFITRIKYRCTNIGFDDLEQTILRDNEQHKTSNFELVINLELEYALPVCTLFIHTASETFDHILSDNSTFQEKLLMLPFVNSRQRKCLTTPMNVSDLKSYNY